MECRKCGSRMEKNWDFCPACGSGQKGQQDNIFSMDFSETFNRIAKQLMEEMEQSRKALEKNFEVMDITPLFNMPKTRGFTIRINSSGGERPKISVGTFGDVNKSEINKELREMGIRPQQAGSKKDLIGPTFRRIYQVGKKAPEVTEEPTARVTPLPAGVMVYIDMPGIKSLNEVEIKELPSSVEVKAFVGKKAYFKILTKPNNTKLTRKKLENGTLEMQFS